MYHKNIAAVERLHNSKALYIFAQAIGKSQNSHTEVLYKKVSRAIAKLDTRKMRRCAKAVAGNVHAANALLTLANEIEQEKLRMNKPVKICTEMVYILV